MQRQLGKKGRIWTKSGVLWTKLGGGVYQASRQGHGHHILCEGGRYWGRQPLGGMARNVRVGAAD